MSEALPILIPAAATWQALASLVAVLPKVEQLHTIIYLDTEPGDAPTDAQRKTAKDAGQPKRSRVNRRFHGLTVRDVHRKVGVSYLVPLAGFRLPPKECCLCRPKLRRPFHVDSRHHPIPTTYLSLTEMLRFAG